MRGACCSQSMRRLLTRPAKGTQPSKSSRHTLLKLLLASTAVAVLLFIAWGSTSTARIRPPPSPKFEPDDKDYGHLAAMLLADNAFPTDTWPSQLWSYILPNLRLRGDDWHAFDGTINATCPVKYKRLKYSSIRRFKAKPYLLGGQRKPECINCRTEGVWQNTCQYLSMGPVCPKEDQQHFWRYLVNRAEAGAPGYQAMLTMTPCDFWPYLRGRTLWVAGDSISQEFMRGFQCFMMEFWDMTVHDIRGELLQGPDLDDMRERVLGGWCVDLPEDTRLCHLRINFPGELVRLLPDYERLTMKRSDIVIFNVGLWLNDVETYSIQMEEFVKYFSDHKSDLPFFLWRDSSVQHFNTPVGNFLTDPVSWDCLPLGTLLGGVGAIAVDDDNIVHRTGPDELELVVEGGWRNKAARPWMAQLGIPLIETWNKTLPIFRYHHHYHENPAHNDCSHWCHPAPYQIWIYDTLIVLKHIWPQYQAHSLGRFNFLDTVDADDTDQDVQ